MINTIQYNTIQYNTIQYNTIQYNTIQYNTIQYNTIQYNTIQYNSMQYNTTNEKTTFWVLAQKSIRILPITPLDTAYSSSLQKQSMVSIVGEYIPNCLVLRLTI